MVRAIKQSVTIQPGGRIELTSGELPEGKRAEVIVLIDSSAPPPSYTKFFGSGKGVFTTPEDTDAHIRQERDAWGQ